MKEGFIFGTTTPISPAEGVTPNAYAKTPECIRLMKEAGIQVSRTFIPFPWTDESMTEIREEYTKTLECIRLYKENGIDTMPAFGTAEQSMVDSMGLVSFVRRYPEWMGGYDDDFYYEVLDKFATKAATDLKGIVTYWQIGNENDMHIFKGSLTHEQNVRYLNALAGGVKKVNPDAVCGINLAGMGDPSERIPGLPNLHSVHPYAKKLITDLYRREGSYFDYIGLDGYYGSWADGGPENWLPYIDQAYEVAVKPVIINEWGYSTLQRGKPRPEADRNRRFNGNVCRYKDWDYNGTNKWLHKDHTPEMQADFITECMKIFYNHPHCIGELFFQWQDMATCWQCGADDCPSETAWGCIDKYGNPKPGYEALKKFAAEIE